MRKCEVNITDKEFSHETICSLTRSAQPRRVLLRWTWALIHMHFIWTIFTSLSIRCTQEIYVISDAQYQLNFFEYFCTSTAFVIMATTVNYTLLGIKTTPIKSHTMKLVCHWFLQQWSAINTKWTMRDPCCHATITWQTPLSIPLILPYQFSQEVAKGYMSSLVPLLLLCLP